MKELCIFVLFALLITSCQETFEQKCMRETIDYTRKYCPKKMEKGITLDSLVYYAQRKEYSYHYSITTDLPKTQIISNYNCEKKKFKNMMLMEIINSVSLKQYKDNGLNFAFYYHIKGDQAPIFRVLITRKDYKK